MNLQARRISGSEFTAEDELEVTLSTDGQDMAYVFHSVELVSGPSVTHGGGASAGYSLHYKSHDRDADDAGVIDYSTVLMGVQQEGKGTSVIKVTAGYILKSVLDTYSAAHAAWYAINKDALDAHALIVAEATIAADATGDKANITLEDLVLSGKPDDIVPEVLTTGEITLTWTDDIFV
jgi:hypothetical protein